MRRLTQTLLLTTFVLALAACGGGDDDDTTADAPDVTDETSADEPPDVLTEEMMACPLDAFSVNAITGLDFAEPDGVIETGDGASCTFGAASGETGIGITTYATTGAAAMDTVTELFDDAEAVELDFADAALWSPSFTTLQVLSGSAGVQIQITDFAGAFGDPLQVATELAEVALG